MSSAEFSLYCHTNKINGKVYIGITSQKPHNRWKHGKGYKNNAHFYGAILKYGWDNFEHEILYTGLSQETAEKLEVKLISEYDSANPQKGYNINIGGSGYKIYSEETKAKISRALKGKPKSDAHKQKLSLARLGKPISEETKQKISRANKGKLVGCKHDISSYKTKAVLCKETGEVFIGTADASTKKSVWQSDISKACNGKLKTAGGYHWQFIERGETDVFT